MYIEVINFCLHAFNSVLRVSRMDVAFAILTMNVSLAIDVAKVALKVFITSMYNVMSGVHLVVLLFLNYDFLRDANGIFGRMVSIRCAAIVVGILCCFLRAPLGLLNRWASVI